VATKDECAVLCLQRSYLIINVSSSATGPTPPPFALRRRGLSDLPASAFDPSRPMLPSRYRGSGRTLGSRSSAVNLLVNFRASARTGATSAAITLPAFVLTRAR